MIPGQICDLKLGEDHRQLDLHGTHSFPCMCFNVDVTRNVAQEVPWHWHEEIEAIVVREGQGQVQCGEETRLLKEGEGVFINANTLHSVKLIEEGCCRLHSLVFSPDLLSGVPGSVFEQRYLRPLLRSSARAVFLCREVGWQREGLDAIEGAYEAYAAETFGWELKVRAELSLLWSAVAGHIPQTEAGTDDTGDIVRLKEMIGYLHKNYDRPILLEEVAAAASVSKRECLRCFQRTIGIAPMQYLQRFRIREAARLLAETDLPVTQIAVRCGFDNPSYFSLLFRRHTGRAPKEYRREFCPASSVSSPPLGYTDINLKTHREQEIT